MASKKETQSPFSIKLQARGLQLSQEKTKIRNKKQTKKEDIINPLAHYWQAKTRKKKQNKIESVIDHYF